MIALAKGISNGAAAIGTVVGKSEILESAFTDTVLISTFGWTPVACAAALKTR
jgi:acetylornithine/succinyldiaminopimelate/putrescine aminotransferase